MIAVVVVVVVVVVVGFCEIYIEIRRNQPADDRRKKGIIKPETYGSLPFSRRE